MAIEREAKATWTGDLRGGQGEFDLESSHAVEHEQVTFASRFEQPGGKTSPEELIAAAHATCFSMALSGGLARAGHSPTKLETDARVTLDDGAIAALASLMNVSALECRRILISTIRGARHAAPAPLAR